MTAPVSLPPLRHRCYDPAPLWLVGLHGGAGVTCLLRAGVPGRESPGRWPDSIPPARCVAVCRGHAAGLEAARGAAREHRDGRTPSGLGLLGLVVVADAPRPTRELTGLRRVIGHAYPRTWFVPWSEEWRHVAHGPLPSPPAVVELTAGLTALIEGASL